MLAIDLHTTAEESHMPLCRQASESSGVRPSMDYENLRDLLSSKPAVVEKQTDLNAELGDSLVSRQQAKKRTAFEAWHRRRLAEISAGKATTITSKQNSVIVAKEKAAVDIQVAEVTSNNATNGVGVLRPPPQSKKSRLLSSVQSLPPRIQTTVAAVAPSSSSQLAAALSAPILKSTPPTNVASSSATSSSNSSLSPTSATAKLAPKLSRHNDAAYYPNIQCILCSEWVCSRNRYMHIESHLQYRPYKCSVCGYDNRKEIFVSLHIKRTHKDGRPEVKYTPDLDLEHRAWLLAEQCLQHTRKVLTKTESAGDEKNSNDSNAPKKSIEDVELISQYADIYRPKIYNTQRAEKSQLIEESRQLGFVPDFSEVTEREAQCQLCSAHILAHQTALEEHCRVHLTRPSYRCNIDECPTEHHSKNFLNRHMKEVHKYRRAPFDVTDVDSGLAAELRTTCNKAFPGKFLPMTTDAASRPVSSTSASTTTDGSNVGTTPTVSAGSLWRNGRRSRISSSSSIGSSNGVNHSGGSLSALQRELLKPPQTTTATNGNNNSNNSVSGGNTPTSPLTPSNSQQQISTPLLAAALQIMSAVSMNGVRRVRSCRLCQAEFSINDADGETERLYAHAKSHLSSAPFACALCGLEASERQHVQTHIKKCHSAELSSSPLAMDAAVVSRMSPALLQQSYLLMAVCFPDVPLVPSMIA